VKPEGEKIPATHDTENCYACEVEKELYLEDTVKPDAIEAGWAFRFDREFEHSFAEVNNPDLPCTCGIKSIKVFIALELAAARKAALTEAIAKVEEGAASY
jgi:hypothetical protein